MFLLLKLYLIIKALVEIKNKKPIGIIFTEIGPNGVYDENAPKIEKEIFELDIPILGLCYKI